jgi:hypothetical protein
MFIIMCCRVATALAIALMAVGWVIVQDFRRTVMLPKRRAGKAEQKISVSTQFGPRNLEKCVENLHFIFVPPSKIFVWEG